MTATKFPWKRFWCPRDGQIASDLNGYLTDPDTRWGRAFNPDVVPFDHFADMPCLVLLGEPGSGKTTALDEIMQQLTGNAGQTENRSTVLRFNLSEFSTDQWMYQRIFENSLLQKWSQNGTYLTLILDSFDECSVPRASAVNLLISGLRALPIDRLSLRIACRTAEWPLAFEEQLRELWQDDHVGVYKLAPLRQVDVDTAAASSGFDPSAFRKALARAEAVPLALRPLTLRFLLAQFGRNLVLPSTQVDLYAAGCRILCDEWNELRETEATASPLSVNDRLAVAARIAAVTIFARRSAVWTDKDEYNASDEAVTVSVLADDPSSSGRLASAAVRDTLRTGLFTSMGLSKMGWVHQTYAEYLAARFLVDNDFSLPQILGLLVHPFDPDSKLMPHLHGTAAWLASMRPDVFHELIRIEPEPLLQSDMATVTSHDRELLVNSLLDFYATEQGLDTGRGNRRRYAKLAHPGLANQLRPYITDYQRGGVVRRVAIDMAKACDVRELVPELTTVALDASDTYGTRVEAADAVAALAGPESKLALKPLAITSDPEDDPDDELKGIALAALWPGQLNSSELFAALTPPRNDMLFGAYFVFLQDLRETLGDALQAEDLLLALQWAQSYAELTGINQLAKLVDVILRAAWAHLDVPGVLKQFARVGLLRIRQLDHILQERDTARHEDEEDDEKNDLVPSTRLIDDLQRDTQKRRKLLAAMVEIISDPESELDPLSILITWPPIVTREDLFWIIEWLESDKDHTKQQTLATLIARSLPNNDPDLLDAVLVARERVPVLAEQCRNQLDAVMLGSPEALKAKEAYESQESHLAALRARRQETSRNTMPRNEQIRIFLDQADAGDAKAWWRLAFALTLADDGTSAGHELMPDVCASPAWKNATAIDRNRMLDAARHYLLDGPLAADQWLGTGTMNWEAIAGFKALVVLLREVPDDPTIMDPSVWQRWAPVVVGYPGSRGIIGEDEADDVMQVAYYAAAPEILTAFGVLIDRAYENMGRIYNLEVFDTCWDSQVAQFLLDKARSSELNSTCLGELLLTLLKHGDVAAREYAVSLVTPESQTPRSPEARSQALVAASALLTYPDEAAWRTVWPMLRADEELGREVILMLHSAPFTEERLAPQMTEAELADLFLWLQSLFPATRTKQQHRGVVTVTPDVSVVHWSHSLSTLIAQRGTDAALKALERIARDSPSEDVRQRIKWELIDAKHILRQRTVPAPPSPAELIALARNQQRRLVQDGGQLLEVILESLARLEAELQHETPAVIDLWNVIRTGKETSYTPKDEEIFSDKIKRHLEADLKRDGIIVNREVQIRRRMGQEPGQETDLQIDALTPGSDPDSYDSITVIAEVKGSWHREVTTAMRTQLAERYLKDSGCPHGLYIVGWFNCPQWDKSDSRRQRADRLKMTLAEARTRFEHQASELSSQGILLRASVLNTALKTSS